MTKSLDFSESVKIPDYQKYLEAFLWKLNIAESLVTQVRQLWYDFPTGEPIEAELKDKYTKTQQDSTLYLETAFYNLYCTKDILIKLIQVCILNSDQSLDMDLIIHQLKQQQAKEIVTALVNLRASEAYQYVAAFVKTNQCLRVIDNLSPSEVNDFNSPTVWLKFSKFMESDRFSTPKTYSSLMADIVIEDYYPEVVGLMENLRQEIDKFLENQKKPKSQVNNQEKVTEKGDDFNNSNMPKSKIEDTAESKSEEDLEEIPDEIEMSLFDHLEELRQRIFAALIAVVIAMIGCFLVVKPIVQLLETPAKGVKFLQLAPGEFFFVSIQVAGYSGILIASPFILYQIIQFVLPGLTRKERGFLAPIIFGSSILFFLGLFFAYEVLIPAALNFFVSYGGDVVEQFWSIDQYFKFVLLLMFSTGLAFQIPVVQLLLGFLGIVSSKQMLSGWRYVIVSAAILGAIITPSTDPLTQSLLGGAVLGLYFSGIGMVKLFGR